LPVSAEEAASLAHPSPALALQSQLDHQLAGLVAQHHRPSSVPGHARWSARRTLAFIVASNTVAWVLAAWAVSSVMTPR
jgi:hypothetical protein